MNKQEFLRRLEGGLAGVAPDEKVAAIQFYTEYFDDAGPEAEQSVLAELGDPDKLAADIKAVSELVEEPTAEDTAPEAPPVLVAEPTIPQQDPINMGEAPAAPDFRFPGGYVPPRYGVQPQGQPYYGAQGQPYTNPASGAAGQPGYNNQPYTQRPATNGGSSVVKVIFTILLVMLFPAFFGIAIAIFVIMLIPFIIGIAFLGSGVLIFFLSLLLFGASIGSGILLLGLSVLFLAGGLAIGWAGIKIFVKGLPAFFRGTGKVFRGVYGS